MFIYMKEAERSKKNKYIINRITEGGKHYFEITFFGKPSERRIKRAVSKCPRELPLVCGGTLLPKPLLKRRLDTTRFNEILLINAFCEIISGQKRAVVYDKSARLCESLYRPLCRVSSLFIITDRPEIYAEFSARALILVGSSPVITRTAALPFPLPALTLEPISAHSGLLLGAGGFMPQGDTVLIGGREAEAALCAAKYCIWEDKFAALALPKTLANGTLSISPRELKKMLDTTR